MHICYALNDGDKNGNSRQTQIACSKQPLLYNMETIHVKVYIKEWHDLHMQEQLGKMKNRDFFY